MLKQELLLRRALRERGYSPAELSIEVNHMLGTSVVEGIKLPLVYPDSFFRKARSLWGRPKKLVFYFNGKITQKGHRGDMLKPFLGVPQSKIVNSSFGRLRIFKDSFNWNYYNNLSRARFGLCPHHADWPGEFLWTYRFVECLLSGAVPVIFRETPLSDAFIQGFSYFWDDLERIHSLSDSAIEEIAEKNYQVSLTRFSLPSLDI